MVYIEAQDKKLKFGIKTNELQAGWFEYQQNQQKWKGHNLSIWSPNREPFFPVLKDIIS